MNQVNFPSGTHPDSRQDIVENTDSFCEEYRDVPAPVMHKLEEFQDMKVGVIFHWGLYAQAGIVESWQLSEEDAWARKKPWRSDLTQLRHDYWALADEFNPTAFDPTAWAAVCKAAGMKYMLFTTKHHDGFNMFDTTESDYKVTNSPFGRDAVAEVTKAFQQAGLTCGAYFSKADWHCPLYWEPGSRPKGRYASYDPREKPELWREFNAFVKRQLLEICSKYGTQEILWLDGGWVNTQNHEFLDMDDIVTTLRAKQPDLIVVDRAVGGTYENYVTPERKIPEVPPVKVWESNIPLAKNWGYVPNDIYKPFEEILDSLVSIVSKGGNVIFGVGPKPDGTLPEEAERVLAQLGAWLDRFGEGIYATRALDPRLLAGTEGAYGTASADAAYVFARTEDGARTLHLPELLRSHLAPALLNEAGTVKTTGESAQIDGVTDRYAVLRFPRS